MPRPVTVDTLYPLPGLEKWRPKALQSLSCLGDSHAANVEKPCLRWKREQPLETTFCLQALTLLTRDPKPTCHTLVGVGGWNKPIPLKNDPETRNQMNAAH